MSDNKYTSEDLKIMQSWPLERKIQVTQTRIIEWYQKNDGKVYVSFSGGKDSTVLLDLVRRIYPDVPAVFIDTGLEYPELREFVKTIPNVTWLKPEMNFRKVIEKYGYPIISKEVSHTVESAKSLLKQGKDGDRLRKIQGRSYTKSGEFSIYNCKKYEYLLYSPFQVSSRCCDVMKKKPVKKYEKESGNRPIIATMACESRMRKTAWLKNGCNAFDSKRPISQPMSFWTEQDVLRYIKDFNISYASVYGDIIKDEIGKYRTTGCHRTGCVFCGFGCHLEKEPNRFQRLKVTHPKLWNYCMKPWDEGGLGMKEVLDYIGVKYE